MRWRGEDILLRANQHQPAVAAPEEERTAHTAAVRKMRQAVILAGDLVQRLCNVHGCCQRDPQAR